jgi:hypothetical protein
LTSAENLKTEISYSENNLRTESQLYIQKESRKEKTTEGHFIIVHKRPKVRYLNNYTVAIS